MSLTDYNRADTLGLVQDFWSPIFEKELRENTLWAGLLADPNYTMDTVKGGDTVKISKINKPSSTIKTIGTDADSFSSNLLTSVQSDLKVNKRCVSSFKFEDLAIIMSQLEQQDSEIREALLADVREQANDWIKGLIVPSTSAPDHSDISAGGDFNMATLSGIRTLAAKAKWGNAQPWYLLADPTFISDMLDDTTLGAANTMGLPASPVIEGMFNFKRMNFTIVEDNSLATDTAFAFIPSFLKVILGQPRFKISDLHAIGQFGYKISVDFPMGGVQLDDERVISIIV
jgi:hypothetical protein